MLSWGIAQDRSLQEFLSCLLIDPVIQNRGRRAAAVKRLREVGQRLPTWSQLAAPEKSLSDELNGVGPDDADPRNLWRVHWFNGPDRKSMVDTPDHIVLPPALTGVKAPIVVLLGCRFPMIGAHKVLAAYACLVPRSLPVASIRRATARYGRRPVTTAVAGSQFRGPWLSWQRGLPAGMSRERFDWLQRWVADPSDIVRTPGTESNVKEIYDKCAELQQNEQNVIINQFSEFPNYLIHYHCTGAAFDAVFKRLQTQQELPARGFCLRDRIGRNDCGRRPPQGIARYKDRGGRGAGMPDHAEQRLRRAQHSRYW